MDCIARFVVSAATAWALATAANAGAMNDTGQIACFDATATSTGSVSSGDPAPEAAGFAGQDCSLGAAAADAVGAQVKIGGSSVAGRDYSKIGNDGSVLAESAMRGTGPTDWGCTRDNVTGLTWQLRGDLDKDYRYSWKNTPNVDNGGDTCGGALSPCDTDTLVAAANLAGHCGATGWTLPTPAQLESLLAYDDPGSSKNLIDRTWFPDQANDGVNPLVFWSSDAANTDGTMAWAADFDFGWTTVASTGSAAYVRLVLPSSSAPPTTRFTTSEPVSGEVVVEDAQTGLMWKQCPQGLSGTGCATGILAALDWSSALATAGSENFAGFTDWRLPNIIELASIRDYTPATDPADVRLPAAFAGTGAFDLYWSSTNTPRPTSLDNALTYLYADGAAHNETFKSQTAMVRLVRAGRFLAAHAPGADTTPDAFTFGGKSAAASTLIESDDITILGITGPTSLKVSGAAQSAYSLDAGVSWSSGIGAVGNGQTIRVRHLTSASVGGVATTTLTVGGTSVGFSSTATASPPGAPTGVTAARGNASATLTFSAPASDGGSPITAYTAISSPAGGSSSCTTTPPLSCTVTGLSNGQSYTFTVTATNAAGTSESSPESNAVTPATVPDPPTAVNATAGAGQATVSFSAPGSDGGSPITAYTAISSPTGGSSSCTIVPPLSCTVTGLINGQTYTFTVAATNVVGPGEPSAESNAVTPTPAPLTIEFTDTPRIEVPLNHKGGYVNFSRLEHVLRVAGGNSAAADLTVSVSSNNAALLPFPRTLSGRGIWIARASGTPEIWEVNLVPVEDQSGTATLTYTVTDGDGLTASVDIDVTVLDGNRQPFATYLPETIRMDENAPAGTYEVPGYLISASPGEGEEFAQTIEHQFHFGHPSAIIDASFEADGTLRFTLSTEFPNLAAFFTWPTDDGVGSNAFCSGTTAQISSFLYAYFASVNAANIAGKHPRCGRPWSILLKGPNTTATSMTVARRVPNTTAGVKQLTRQVELSYVVTFENTGSMPVEAATVTIPAPANLANRQWTCTLTVGSCSPASGTGAVSTLIDLDLDEVAEIVVTGSVSATTSFIKLTPTLTFAEGVEGFVLGNGVERTDVVADAHVFVGGFEGRDVAF